MPLSRDAIRSSSLTRLICGISALNRVNPSAAERREKLSVASQTHSSAGPFFRVLTAPGRGAIGVVRVWGAGAVEAVGKAFRAGTARPLGESVPGRLVLGRMGTGLGDEVVAVVLDSAIPAVEIQCHGGPAAVAMVLDSLERAGALRDDRWAIPGLDHPAGDPLSAQAIEDLALAPTVLHGRDPP